jgi:hypothetical protein
MGGHSCLLRHCWRAKCWFQIRRDKLMARRATLSLPIPAREPCLITYRNLEEENRVWTRRKSQPCRDHMGFHKERTRKIVSWFEVARLSNFGLAEPRNTNPPFNGVLESGPNVVRLSQHRQSSAFRIWGIQHLPLTGIPKWSQQRLWQRNDKITRIVIPQNLVSRPRENVRQQIMKDRRKTVWSCSSKELCSVLIRQQFHRANES